MKTLFKVVLGLFIVLVLFGGGAVFYLTRGLEAGNYISINDVDLTTLGDGTYSGKYDSGRWSNEINVTIKDHKIIEITMVEDVNFVQEDVKEELFKNVIKNQNTNVDAIAGATVTSKAYLKSIENALINR